MCLTFRVLDWKKDLFQVIGWNNSTFGQADHRGCFPFYLEHFWAIYTSHHLSEIAKNISLCGVRFIHGHPKNQLAALTGHEGIFSIFPRICEFTKAFQATRLRSQKSSVAHAEVDSGWWSRPPKGESDEPLGKKRRRSSWKKRFHQFLGSMFRGGKRWQLAQHRRLHNFQKKQATHTMLSAVSARKSSATPAASATTPV